MLLSNSFIPILKNNPSEAKIKSHQLMLRAGMIKQASAGIYSWLPLGFKVMKKIEDIVRQEQNKIGAQEILMPTIQSSEIWKESGRYDDYGEEMLRITDRQNREMLYGPTNEEQVTEIFRSSIKSYKSLPQLMYHIQWKFRDEIRPRFGIMRGREFYMKDAYSFDVSDEEAFYSYNKFFLSYLRTFKRLSLTAIPMAADTGPIGGNLSHEFIILADTGESKIFTDKRIFELNSDDTQLEKTSLESMRKKYEQFYAVTDEKFNKEEFEKIVSMMKIQELGSDIYRSFYIDGRLYHHLVVNEQQPKLGIQDIRNIDATKVRKVKNIKYKKDDTTGAKVVDKVEEFYIFQEKSGSNQGIKLSPDSVSYVTSGLLDPAKKQVLSYLHKALKPINQLRMMEDSLVIYRLARAPERRIFYIDVGNMPRGKSEAYMKDIMTRYRNKLVYDASTGELKDDRKHMSMLEDFWLPRREGGRGTEITTLPGGENLGQIDDIVYFQKRLYRSLNVPLSRLEQEAQFSLGRSTEINRDEVKFQKFIDKIRKRFSKMFIEILRKQLILKGIITDQDWNTWKNDITVDFLRDNHFAELKDAEVLQNRLNTLDQISQYVGEYFSREWVMKNVMQMSEEDIENMKDQVEGENASGDDEETDDAGDDF